MKRTNRLILLVGILLAAVAFVGIIFVFNNQGKGGTSRCAPGERRRREPGHQAGRRDRPSGMSPRSRSRRRTRSGRVLQAARRRHRPGRSRTDIAKGAFLTQSMFAGTGQQSIAKDLPAGLVAVAVRVDAVTGVGTLIHPGDRVDVVVTLEIAQTLLVPGADPSAPPQAVDLPGLSRRLLEDHPPERRGARESSERPPASGTTDTTGTATDAHGRAAGRHPRDDAAAGRGRAVPPAGREGDGDGAAGEQHHARPAVAEGQGRGGRRDDRRRAQDAHRGATASSRRSILEASLPPTQ